MENKLFMRADEVAKELGVSQAYAYKLIKELNKELRAKGYLVINGRLNREYFSEKVYSKHCRKESANKKSSPKIKKVSRTCERQKGTTK